MARSRSPERHRKRYRSRSISRDKLKAQEAQKEKESKEKEKEKEKEEKGPKASQKEIDDLEDKIDKIETVYDVCVVMSLLSSAAISDKRFPKDSQASFFLSFVRKATTYFSISISDAVLKFIDRYLSQQGIRTIDYMVSKYLNLVEGSIMSDQVRTAYKRVLDGRRNYSRPVNLVKACPSCGCIPGEINKPATPTTPAPPVPDNTITLDPPTPVPPKENKKETLQNEVKTIMQAVDKKNGPNISEERKRVKSHFDTRKDPQDEDEIEATALQVSLQCPLSFMRIAVPSKGLECKHIQCFDLESFLVTNLGRKKKRKEREKERERYESTGSWDRDREMREREARDKKSNDDWRCPVCTKILRKEDLYVDKYFLDILNKAEPKIRSAEIKPDGSWSLVTDKSTAKTEFKDVVIVDDDAPELPFDWSTIPVVKTEPVDVEEAAEADVDWKSMFEKNVERWIKKRFPQCHRRLLGVTKDELLMTPKPMFNLIFPDLGIGNKLFDDLNQYRPPIITQTLSEAAPYYTKFTKKITTTQATPSLDVTQDQASPTSPPTTTIATPTVENEDEEGYEIDEAGKKVRLRGGKKKKKTDTTPTTIIKPPVLHAKPGAASTAKNNPSSPTSSKPAAKPNAKTHTREQLV
eukprot:NODE_1259_length_2040_cov_73.537298_g1067_i0.p1 GENE.NODE_1259_length_2040_cov_73.537298_g1067_i0~~NODE_1259_length_2040_cov_73.537298_g1067_i0.p1  ORF type:complete len:637 (+),score=134.68 NODE_1259_length_2040_cov_73.537298_g1067_i0:52-1962(+)